MLKNILLGLLICLFTQVCEAEWYVCLSRVDGSPQGGVSIKPEALADWSKDYIMIEADETYRGKHGYEMKYSNQKLRHATEGEIDTYKAEKEQAKEAKKRLKALEALGLDEDDLLNIKDLKNK